MRRAKPTGAVTAIIDGAARGNPGPAAYGVVFKDASGKVLARLKARLGTTTNNVAEYRGLIAALAYAHRQGWRRLKILTDSELLARQLDGTYRVRSLDLKPLYEEACHLIAQLSRTAGFAVEAVPRKQTREADKLANAALDQRPAARGPRPAPGTASIPAAPAAGIVRVRAVYKSGVLKPRVPLDLEEGEEVELEVRRKPRR